ncbi:MAG: sigma-70 family RNA polymerase sigma factor, partial [Gammaproteobacteria bacterium]|nr:sigma-70 family RNA polymerase sigma factor [Gammaproteobacteria bacterium]
HVVKELSVNRRAARELALQLDHEPTAEDIASFLDKPATDVARMLILNERVVSVDAPIGIDSEQCLLDAIPDSQDSNPASLHQDNDLNTNINKWLMELNPKQREVIVRRYGLQGHEPCTLEEVGSELGVTRERIRQIQVEALERLQVILTRHGLSNETV